MELIFLLGVIAIAVAIIVISIIDGIVETEYEKGNPVVTETIDKLYDKCIGCSDFRTCAKGIEEVRECKR